MLLSRIAVGDGGVALVPAVTTADAKAHLNVLHASDDDLIAALVSVAQQHLEGEDGLGGVLGRAVVQHTLEMHLGGFPPEDVIRLPQPPLVSVTSVTYLDTDGDEQTLSASKYAVHIDRGPGYIRLKPDQAWPGTQSGVDDAVRVRFVAGYASVPAGLRHAILLHVGHLYLNREATGDANQVLPMAWKALTDPYRTHGWI